MVRFINLKFGWYLFYKNSNTRQFKHLQKKRNFLTNDKEPVSFRYLNQFFSHQYYGYRCNSTLKGPHFLEPANFYNGPF